jgi:F-box protein 11
MSYVRSDDEHEHGRLTEFRERLSAEVRMQTGDEFPIFQDRNDIGWGQNWKKRIKESLDGVTFLIPIITPSFFKSPACRDELERFLEREKTLSRDDLILPVYYVDCPLLSDDKKRAKDELAQVVAERQYADWRELRFELFTSPQVGRAFAQLAVQIREALERTAAGGKPKAARVTRRRALRPPAEPPAGAESGTEGAETTARPAPKTEPPTRVVDPMHRGDHPTITEAITAASPGDRILVRPGLYEEGLVIDKPLEIIGQGDPGEVVVQALGKNVILFKTTMGRVANLTLRQTGGDSYGVSIAQGRLEMEDCDITSQSLAGVAIYGGADPRLRRNRIHDGKNAGVFVYNNGQGTLEDNDIFANAKSGVWISTGGNPTLRRNRIHDGKNAGVFVYNNGQGTLEDNDIFANAHAGVAIMTGGNPTLRRNRIHDGKNAGVFVYNNGQGTLEDNDIFANALAGAIIMTGSNPTLRRNRIHDGKDAGVFVLDNGQGTLEDNDIFANALAGAIIKTGGNPTLRRNRIHDGKQDGVLVLEDGQGTLEDSDIFANAYAGVAIRTGGNPTVRRNRINKNGYQGVWVYQAGAGTIEDNDLRDNAGGAWNVSGDSEAKVKRARNQE